MGALGVLGHTAINAYMQQPDFENMWDMTKEITKPLFRPRPIGTGLNQRNIMKWRQQINRPLPVAKFFNNNKNASGNIKENRMLNNEYIKKIAKESIRRHGIFCEKTAAAAPSLYKNMAALKPLLTSPVMLGASLLGTYALGKNIFNSINDTYKAHSAYEEMFEKFPSLKEAPAAKIDDYWNILRDYAPTMTHNPVVAGQFIKNMIDFGMEGIDHPTLKTLLEIQHKNNEAFGESPMSLKEVVKVF